MQEFSHVPIHSYDEFRAQIRSGDILLCSGSSIFSNMIQKATQSLWSHVGFILRLDVIDRIMVLESVESIGVRTVPLRTYINDYNGTERGYPGQILLARHQDFNHERMKNLSKFAVDLLGHPYDTNEILRIAARLSMNTVGLRPAAHDPTPTREFICSEYAYVCFESIGVNIEWNTLGFISPADFANSKKVAPISFIMTENQEGFHHQIKHHEPIMQT